MAAIPCVDFFEQVVGIIPGRPKRANPDSIAGRHANLYYSMDLSPLAGDEEVGNQNGAWSIGDIPASFAAQIDDDDGNDLITVAVKNRVYALDRTKFRDEWDFNTYAPIYRQLTIGPIPHSSDESTRGGYSLDEIKRFIEFQFANRDLPEDGPRSKWRISVGEWKNEDATYRTTTREGSQKMRAKLSPKGKAFTVRLEHAANEPIHLESWEAIWTSLGRRIPQSGKVS